MVAIHVVYEGDLRCQATHGPSGETLMTDAPADNHGRGESFSPTDLVATALGTCMATLMGIAAEKQGWKLAGTTVNVEKRMVNAPARRIAELLVDIRVPGRFDPDQRTVLERAAMSCPVHASLRPEVQIPVTFHWDEA